MPTPTGASHWRAGSRPRCSASSPSRSSSRSPTPAGARRGSRCPGLCRKRRVVRSARSVPDTDRTLGQQGQHLGALGLPAWPPDCGRGPVRLGMDPVQGSRLVSATAAFVTVATLAFLVGEATAPLAGILLATALFAMSAMHVVRSLRVERAALPRVPRPTLRRWSDVMSSPGSAACGRRSPR